MQHHGLRVLLVEDQRELAESLAGWLRMAGHEVGIAGDGAKAVEVARLRQPDVVFFEIALPGLDGYAVARRIQEQSAWKRPLLVAFAEETDTEACRRAHEAGIDLLLSKPLDLALLRDLLRRFQSVVGETETFDPGL